MKLNFRNRLVLCFVASLVSTLTSCSSAPPSPTSIPPQPTSTATATSDLLEAGRYYSDPSDDMEISFLDVVGFQATVNEESETLEVILQMRDIPLTAPRGQATNVFEYF
ncbi:MAG TPA: hypothetical protein VJM08_04570, partial [Anaerolineales bacterium]|nr:hypothetical protein [Anaerolineales bacterium]